MSTFSLWWQGFQKKKEVRQVTWLCGTETILIDEIVENIKYELAVDPWNFSLLVAGEDSERTIWTDVHQHPLGINKNRLVIIRQAQNLKNTDRIIEFMKNRTANAHTYLIFVSAEESAPKIEPTPQERREGGKAVLVPHLAAIYGKGHIIECKPFTQATAKHAIAWVQSKVSLRQGVAGYLLNRADGNLRLVRDTLVKLALFPDEISITTINGMLAEQPRDSFTDALLALDKKTAFHALSVLSEEEYGRVIGQLDSQLDLAGLVHDMQIDHKSASEMAKAVGRRSFLVPEVLKVAKHYDKKRRQSIRDALAVADEAYQQGSKVGVLESIVAAW